MNKHSLGHFFNRIACKKGLSINIFGVVLYVLFQITPMSSDQFPIFRGMIVDISAFQLMLMLIKNQTKGRYLALGLLLLGLAYYALSDSQHNHIAFLALWIRQIIIGLCGAILCHIIRKKEKIK